MFDHSAHSAYFSAAPSADDLARRLRAMFEALRRRIEASRKGAARRKTARGLSRLDAHLLDDIGLSRADVRLALRGAGGVF